MISPAWLLLSSFVIGLTAGGGSYQNPILSSSSPDPFVIHHMDNYYMVLSDSHRTISVLRSPILTDWRNASSRVVWTAPDNMDNLFAPEMQFVNGQLYIYFTMDDGRDENHRMHVLRAQDPNFPESNYVYLNQITHETDDFFAIDGTILSWTNGSLYFLWSGWPEATLGGKPYGANMYIAKMANATHISSQRVLLRSPVYDWEGTTVEGPEILRRSPQSTRTVLMYSAASTWDKSYCMSMLYIDEGQDPLDTENWKQPYDTPLFSVNEEQGVYGPGHGSFTVSPDGRESFLVYHAMDGSLNGNNRTARTERFYWNLDDTPYFGPPTGFGIDIPLPSGQQA